MVWAGRSGDFRPPLDDHPCFQERYLKTDVAAGYSFFFAQIRVLPYLLSPPFGNDSGYVPQPIFTQANSGRREVRRLKTKKKVTLNEHARRQEAKFWAMMRAADPGKRCLK